MTKLIKQTDHTPLELERLESSDYVALETERQKTIRTGIVWVAIVGLSALGVVNFEWLSGPFFRLWWIVSGGLY